MSASEMPPSDAPIHLYRPSDITDTFRPVKIGERISSIDVLRGFALFGIIVINIDLYAMVDVIFLDPSAMGGFTGINLFIFRMNNLLFMAQSYLQETPAHAVDENSTVVEYDKA